ncbi:MAG: o-succinylbenzoate synthase [Longimicrobiales bacterium]
MKIERATLREVRLRLREPFRTSRGVIQDRGILLVTLEGGGQEGWGECVAGVDASSPETPDSAWQVLERSLLPGALGLDLAHPDDAVPGRAGDHRMAAAALEMAAWDLAARLEGVSLSHKLGGMQPTVPVGVSIGLQDSEDELLEVVARSVDDGYARVKVKIEPGRDVDMLAKVRAHFPAVRLWADANAAYTLADLDRLRELDALGLELLEQPLGAHDLEGHARLQDSLATPICLDESISCEVDARRAIELRACRVVNLKPGRVGGHAESVRIHDLLRAHGVPVWCGGMLESGVGRAHNLALASLPGFTLPGDISASRRYWDLDIVTPPHEVVDGHMRVPSGPGIGVEIDVDFVRALTVRASSF